MSLNMYGSQRRITVWRQDYDFWLSKYNGYVEVDFKIVVFNRLRKQDNS